MEQHNDDPTLGCIVPDDKKEDKEWQGLGRMTMSVEYVRAKLTIKTIPNIIGETSYKAINEIREALYGNAAAIPISLMAL